MSPKPRMKLKSVDATAEYLRARMLTVQQAAKVLGVSKGKVYDLIAHGDLPVVTYPRTRGTWIETHDLECFVASRKRTPNSHLKVAP